MTMGLLHFSFFFPSAFVPKELMKNNAMIVLGCFKSLYLVRTEGNTESRFALKSVQLPVAFEGGVSRQQGRMSYECVKYAYL